MSERLWVSLSRGGVHGAFDVWAPCSRAVGTRKSTKRTRRAPPTNVTSGAVVPSLTDPIMFGQVVTALFWARTVRSLSQTSSTPDFWAPEVVTAGRWHVTQMALTRWR